jgi:hypothetical protein
MYDRGMLMQTLIATWPFSSPHAQAITPRLSSPPAPRHPNPAALDASR